MISPPKDDQDRLRSTLAEALGGLNGVIEEAEVTRARMAINFGVLRGPGHARDSEPRYNRLLKGRPLSMTADSARSRHLAAIGA